MAVVATGFFDGVHLGHRLVLETLVEESRRRSEEAVAITFWPHPRAVIGKDGSPSLLTTADEREALIFETGVDRVETLKFDSAFSSLDGRGYLKMLGDRFSATEIVVGYDTRVGSDRLGPAEISSAAAGLGMESLVLGALASISSTGIRRCLEDGRVEDAACMLGYRYGLSGTVVRGNRLGRVMGFPTANLEPFSALKAVPRNGVYLTEVEIRSERYYGMTNIGIRPTLSSGGNVTVETNIFGFNDEIYGLPVNLRFVSRIRDERRFSSMEALAEQLCADRRHCLEKITAL